MRTKCGRAAFGLVAGLALLAAALSAALSAQQTPTATSAESLARALDAVRAAPGAAKLPAAERFTFGDRTIAAGSTAEGPIAVADGTLHVRGTVHGDAVSFRGDIVVHQGGEVRGDALAILGRVTLDGGRVTGEALALGGNLSPVQSAAPASRTPRGTVLASLALAAGWIAVLAIVGIGVLVFASSNLDTVAATLERDFGRALLAGVAAQLALVPALVLLVLGLALTLLGILLIPFAIVAYVLAAAGLLTLGYLAIARITGRSLLGSTAADERALRLEALRGLLYGVLVLMCPWLVAAALAWSPAGSAIARTVAIGITWVAATAGLGAALVSRGGVRRAIAPAARQALASAAWQTPTPVSGVVAARRPTPLATPVPK